VNTVALLSKADRDLRNGPAVIQLFCWVVATPGIVKTVLGEYPIQTAENAA